MKVLAMTRDWLVWEEIKEDKRKAVGHKNLYRILASKTFLLTFLLALFGVAMIGSASVSVADANFSNPFHYMQRQAFYVLLGLAIGVVLIKIPVSFWEKNGPGIFLIAAIMLIAVLFIGVQVNSSTRWLRVAGINFQPSEFAKLAAVIYMSGYLVRHKQKVRQNLLAFLRPVILISAVGALILVEPDLGGMLILVLVSLSMLYMGGVKFLQFMAFIIAIALVAWLALYFGPDYRLERILSLYDDIWNNPYGRNYQITQSLIAFGNGQLSGLGFGAGVQKLFYLPEAHTDFIFAVLAEELGLIGSILLLLAFSWLIWSITSIGKKAIACGHDFAAFVTYGVAMWIALQVFINTGVNMRLLPITGMTLPFISYGGSSIFILSAAICIVLRIEYELCPVRSASATSASLRQKKS